jgi:DNA integrity scanning protein DisA with diadenylate cyclase activity
MFTTVRLADVANGVATKFLVSKRSDGRRTNVVQLGFEEETRQLQLRPLQVHVDSTYNEIMLVWSDEAINLHE